MKPAIRSRSMTAEPQTVSELSAVGAPTRALWMWLAIPYTLLVTGFGWGVYRSAAGNRALRVVGRLVLAYGALGLVWPFTPMHLREVLVSGGATMSDTLHITIASVTVILFLLAVGFGAAALGRPLRVYSVATLAVVLVFGALTFRDAPGVSVNGPTPLIGVWERVNIGAFLLWVIVLAAALLTARDSAEVP